MALSADELLRYSRQVMMPEVGIEGQSKLKNASVLLVGVGGLGSPVGLYLAAAGVGRIGLVDFDAVDLSNLHRQVIHGTKDVGRSKLDSAVESLRDINPHVQLDRYDAPLTAASAPSILNNYDVVVDGSDNFPTRYVVNDACVLLGKPNVYGSVYRFEGQATVFAVAGGPCYRCLHPQPPSPGSIPNCAAGGVLGILPGVIGLIQATEVVKLLVGIGDSLVGRLLQFDALAMKFREVKLVRDPQCPICGDHPSIHELIDYDQFCGTSNPKALDEIEPSTVREKLDRGDRFVLIDVREPHELEIARIEGAMLIPLGEIASKVHELDPELEVVVFCRSGARSARAAEFLQSAGFLHVKSMRGGVLAWSAEFDPTVTKS